MMAARKRPLDAGEMMCRPIDLRAVLSHDRALLRAAARSHGARAPAKYGDLVWRAAKGRNVCLHPLQREALVHQPIVACTPRARLRERRACANAATTRSAHQWRRWW
jgi:hypothetical protein